MASARAFVVSITALLVVALTGAVAVLALERLGLVIVIAVCGAAILGGLWALLHRLSSAVIVLFIAVAPLPIWASVGLNVYLVFVPLLALALTLEGSLGRASRLPVLPLAGLVTLFAAGALSSLDAAYPEEVRSTLLQIAKFVSMAVLVGIAVQSKEERQPVVYAIVLSAGLHAMVALSQQLFGLEFSIGGTLVERQTSLVDGSVRIRGLFAHANLLADYLAIAAPFALLWVVEARSLFWRCFAGSIFLVVIGAVVLSHSRGGLLALAVGIGIFAAFWALHRGTRILTSYATAGLIVGGLVISIGSVGSLFSYFDSTPADLAGPWGRPAYWRLLNSLPTESQRITGIGLGNLVKVNKYRPPGTTADNATAHNLYLQVFLETGWVGLIAGAFFLASLAACLAGPLVRGPTVEARDWAFVVAIAASWLALLTHSLFEYLLLASGGSTTFGLLFGVTLGLAASLRAESAMTETATTEVHGEPIVVTA